VRVYGTTTMAIPSIVKKITNRTEVNGVCRQQQIYIRKMVSVNRASSRYQGSSSPPSRFLVTFLLVMFTWITVFVPLLRFVWYDDSKFFYLVPDDTASSSRSSNGASTDTITPLNFLQPSVAQTASNQQVRGEGDISQQKANDEEEAGDLEQPDEEEVGDTEQHDEEEEEDTEHSTSVTHFSWDEEWMDANVYIQSLQKVGRDEKSLIFLHIPKTAGTAIEYAAGTQQIPWGSCRFSHKPKRDICNYPKGGEDCTLIFMSTYGIC
jgi:hypothetical protein